MFEQVKQEIDDKIKTNGNNEITATRLNGVLQDMMDASAEVIEEVQRSIGDQVEANPTGAATTPLNKIKIGEINYSIPQTDISNLATKTELQQGLSGKQDTISDLSTIRSGAAAGATAIQPSATAGLLKNDGTVDTQTEGKAASALQPVSGATENNFASFDENGGLQDRGYNKDSFATAAQGTKADNAIPMPTGGSNEQILAKDSSETAGVKWVNKPTNGKSAYQIAVDNGFVGTEEQWLASLKANIGAFQFITPTDITAEAALTSVGSTYASAIGGVSPLQSTLSVILLMNDSNNTKTMMIATQDDGNSGFEFVYAGDLQSAMPSNVLTEDDLIQNANTEDDLDITDEQGNIIVKFHDKEIETKNFNSALAPQEGDADRTLDYAVTDPNGKNIFGVQAGYLVTKHFDGATIKGMVLEHESEIGSLNTEVDALNDSIPIIDEIYGWESIDPNNPLKKIRFDAGLTPVIRHWGFIGDSLSSGCHGYDTGVGTGTGVDIYGYSWGQFICRLCGSEGYNFSYGGGTAKAWLTNSRGWPAAQITENHKQAYTIALGINDSTLMSSIYPDGLGDADTDLVVNPSNPYDYSNNNEDTYVGCYGGIIQRLRSVNPRCRIFVLTMLDKNFNHAGHLAMDSEIRKIASKFENVYVIDLALYAPQYYGSPLHDNLVYWSHLTSVGYVWLAYVINTYIDWIIRTNLYAFRDIAFIGTDKYMNQNL